MRKWEDHRFVGFDFETSGTLPEYGLQPWRVAQGKAWVTSLAVAEKTADGLHTTGGLNPTVNQMRAFLEDAIAMDQTIVGWNVTFDIGWLIAYGLRDLVFKAKWLDGMRLWRHYFLEPEYDKTGRQKKSYTLKKCVAEHLPQYAGYEEDIDFHDPDPKVRAALHEYNVKDTVFTLRLTRKFYNLLAQEPERLRAALLEARCLPMVAEANFRGMVVDTLAASELKQHMTDIADEKLRELAPHGVTEKVIRSPLQLSALMFDEWKLKVIKTNKSAKTGKVSRSTDKEVLHELSFKDDRVKKLQDYREALNNRTKFAESVLTSAEYNEDGRTRPEAIVFGTYSGRLTYGSKQGRNKDTRQTGFALHQMKRGNEYRSTIVPPEGYTLMEFDAAGQEFRWMAIASKDETMLSLCERGEDAHSFMGSRIAGMDYRELVKLYKAEDAHAGEQRRLGKVANLSLQYRTSAAKLMSVARVQYGLPMTASEARKIHGTYQNSYPGVPRYWADQINEVRSAGYVATFAGRRVVVKGNWDGSFGWSMGSTAINYKIQGTGADQKYLALAVLQEYFEQLGAKFAWDLHDGIYVYMPDRHVKRAAVEVTEKLLKLPYKAAWGFVPPVELPWDCKVGKSWGTLKEYRYD